jgi:dUTP pyrophosphatase
MNTDELKRKIEEGQAQVAKHTQMLRDQMFKIEVEVLEGGKLPTKAHASDAGFDVYATEDIMVFPGQVIKHPLNIRIKPPVGTWCRIETKSGLGSKGHMVWAGVIDQNYRGIPHVIMTNLNWNAKPFIDQDNEPNLQLDPQPIVIKKGDRIAQITMNPHSNEFFIVQVDKVDTNTDRGEGGFGSSGV